VGFGLGLTDWDGLASPLIAFGGEMEARMVVGL
jgi:hypothetical protein